MMSSKNEEELPTDHTSQSTKPHPNGHRPKVTIPSIFQVKPSGYNRVEQYCMHDLPIPHDMYCMSLH